MPPRYSYWTILAGGLPTAFRAADRDELLPTFHQLRAKHPDAELRWFQRGKLWDSPESARAHGLESSRTKTVQTRGRDWRPGGEHRDPKQRFEDAKRARNQGRRRVRFERRQSNESTPTPAPRAKGPRRRR